MWAAFLDRCRLAIREARAIRVALLLSAAVLVLHWALAAWFVVPRLGNPIFALHYTVYFGVDSIGSAWGLLATPALGTAILLINGAMAAIFYVKNRWAGIFMAVLTVMLQLLLAVSTLLIVNLNL